MSHSVTITRTVTSSNTTSTLVLNTGYLKTCQGLLKLAQLVRNLENSRRRRNPCASWQKWFPLQIIGAACVGIMAYNFHNGYVYGGTEALFFLLMATSFLIGTFCLLISCLFSLSTGGIISKTIYVSFTHKIAIVAVFLPLEFSNLQWKNYLP